MQVSPYLSFAGNCEEALTFYARCLDGRLGEMFRYAGSPMMDDVPPDWSSKVMHGSVTLGDMVLMGADVAGYEPQPLSGFSLSIHIADPALAERFFHALAEGGRIVMPLQQTFWAERFGQLLDRFGVAWAINCEGAAA